MQTYFSSVKRRCCSFPLAQSSRCIVPAIICIDGENQCCEFSKKADNQKIIQKIFQHLYLHMGLSDVPRIYDSENKRQKHKVSLIQKKIGNFTTLPSYPFVPQQPGVRQKCIYVSNQGRFPAFKALLAYFHNSSNLGSGGTRHL